MMRKLSLTAAGMVLFACLAGAQAQFRLAADVSSDFAQKPTLDVVQQSFDDQANLFNGFHWEVVINHLGFGVHHLIKYERLETNVESPPFEYDSWLDWNGALFLSFHLFTPGNVVDPFVEMGYGNVGRVNLTDEERGYWQATGDTYTYVDEYPREPVFGLTNISLYAYAAAGLALDLEGFLVGAKLGIRPMMNPVPGVTTERYPLTSFQVAIFGGIALGGRRN